MFKAILLTGFFLFDCLAVTLETEGDSSVPVSHRRLRRPSWGDHVELAISSLLSPVSGRSYQHTSSIWIRPQEIENGQIAKVWILRIQNPLSIKFCLFGGNKRFDLIRKFCSEIFNPSNSVFLLNPSARGGTVDGIVDGIPFGVISSI